MHPGFIKYAPQELKMDPRESGMHEVMHTTTRENAQSIVEHGFDPQSPTLLGGEFGHGIYGSFETLSGYRGQDSAQASLSDPVQMKLDVNYEHPFVLEAKDFEQESKSGTYVDTPTHGQIVDMLGGNYDKLLAQRESNPDSSFREDRAYAVTQAAKDAGYDAIVWSDPMNEDPESWGDQIVVFNSDQVHVVDSGLAGPTVLDFSQYAPTPDFTGVGELNNRRGAAAAREQDFHATAGLMTVPQFLAFLDTRAPKKSSVVVVTGHARLAYSENQARDDHGRFAAELNELKPKANEPLATMSVLPKETQDKVLENVRDRVGVDPGQVQGIYDQMFQSAKDRGSTYEEGMHWYQNVHDNAQALADKYGSTLENVAGMYASMSPGMLWDAENNVVSSMVQMDAQNIQMSPEVLNALNDKLVNDYHLDPVANGQAYHDLDSRTAVIAMHSQYMESGPGSQHTADTGWGVRYGYNGFQKGLDILRGDTSVEHALNGVKVREFYDNIAHPELDGHTTIDVMMMRSLNKDQDFQNGTKVTGFPSYKTVPVGPTPFLADAVRNIASREGILANQAQAIIWSEWLAQAQETGHGGVRGGTRAATVRSKRENTAVVLNPLKGADDEVPTPSPEWQQAIDEAVTRLDLSRARALKPKRAYSPDQPRDDHGRFGEGSGSRPEFTESHAAAVAKLADGKEKFAVQHGLGTPPAKDWQSITADPARGQRIANDYAALPSVDGPEAERAYSALRDEVKAQYDYLTNTLGIKVDVTKDDPYHNVTELRNDIENNGHLAVLATAETGGHPFFTDRENDMFRAVHDAFGHAAIGRGFDRNGEEAAYQSHAQMFSKEALPALATETRGQNSSLIYGSDHTFPEQKVALLPTADWRVAAAAAAAAQASADDDNHYDFTHVHHTSLGRSLHGRTRRAYSESQERDDHGRFSSNGDSNRNDGASNRTEMERSIIETTAAQGGMSMLPLTGEVPEHGYMVALGGTSTIMNENDFYGQHGVDVLDHYLAEHAQEFDHGEAWLGLWHDTDHHEVVLDIAVNVQERDRAYTEMVRENQQSMYNVDTGNVEDSKGLGTGARDVAEHQ